MEFNVGLAVNARYYSGVVGLKLDSDAMEQCSQQNNGFPKFLLNEYLVKYFNMY